jgi:hypothetical protein
MTETNKQQLGAVAPARKGKMKNNNKTGAGTKEPNTDSTGPTVPKQGNSRLKTFGNIALGAVVLALFGIGGSSLRGDDGKHSDAHWKTIVIDVANDARTASVNTASPTDTEPKRGATGIANGKIYPGGTIAAGNGLDIDTLTGSIGTFITKDTFNVDFSQILAGAHPGLSSTEYYLFSPTGALDGEEALMSEGPAFGATTHRVVLGGTGLYRGVIGEVKQETLGMNSTGFANFRFTFTIRTPE